MVAEQAARQGLVAQITERVVHQREAQAREGRAVLIGGVLGHLLFGEQQAPLVVVVAREPGRVEADDVDGREAGQRQGLPIPEDGVPARAVWQQLRAFDALQERTVAALALGGQLEAILGRALGAATAREPSAQRGVVMRVRRESAQPGPARRVEGPLDVVVAGHKKHPVPGEAEALHHLVKPPLGRAVFFGQTPIGEIPSEHEQVWGALLHDGVEALVQRRAEHPIPLGAAEPNPELAVAGQPVQVHPLMQIREVQHPQRGARGRRRDGRGGGGHPRAPTRRELGEPEGLGHLSGALPAAQPTQQRLKVWVLHPRTCGAGDPQRRRVEAEPRREHAGVGLGLLHRGAGRRGLSPRGGRGVEGAQTLDHHRRIVEHEPMCAPLSPDGQGREHLRVVLCVGQPHRAFVQGGGQGRGV